MKKQITIGDLLKIFLQHIKLIIIVTLLGGLLAFLYVTYLVTPMYSTSALILVQNGNTFESDINKANNSTLNGEKVNTSDITSSQMLANTCSTLFTVDPDMKSIISGASISISVVENSYFLRISSTSSDPHTAANIANLVANTAPQVFKKYFGDAGKVDTVEEANVPSSPSSPNKPRYVLIGLLVGLVLSLVISFLLEIIDTTIKPGDDLYKMYDIPVFAEIVDFETEGGGKKR
ncbi:YveK family protein [Ruminococcus sp.]|uniref:YveK family protein n=1 Tax=Ruminococcus sp. TaxID=41978 RepID=UPI002E815844|nr:Wzz/FepE/Etk N-terminal domain-containing protein [Ruminococcus sp.]MEE3492897.1 Wzz/FepE/Etk N-terminal domain-containing protein [Ruminococcus sp.]